MSIVRPISRRVDDLEELMAQLTLNVNQVSQDMPASDERARRANEALGEHLADISNELRANIKNLSLEMRVSEEKTRQANETLRRTLRDADERSRKADERAREADEALRQRIDKISKEMSKSRRELNKKMAEMSDKMGTFAEDLIAPSIPAILAQVVNCTEEPEMEGVRVRKRLSGGRSQEYDVIAVCGDYVLICETKSRLRPEYIRDFCDTLSQARDFLPEYADKQIIGALATFYVDPSLIKHGERHGLIMLGVIDGLMQILNEDGFVPKGYSIVRHTRTVNSRRTHPQPLSRGEFIQDSPLERGWGCVLSCASFSL